MLLRYFLNDLEMVSGVPTTTGTIFSFYIIIVIKIADNNYYSSLVVVFYWIFGSHYQGLESQVGNFSARIFQLMDVASIKLRSCYIIFPHKFDPINADK